MTPDVIRYKLDPTGTNPNNLVQGEVHEMVRRTVRAIATTYGAFFTESLRVVDTATNKPLTPGKQYVASELYAEPTARFGKEVCAIILITDTTVSDTVSIQYQAVGGQYSNSVTAIQQLITALSLDDRPVSKDSIINWPSAFPPSHHLHDVGDTYGWEFVTNAINRVLSAVQANKTARYDALYAYIDMVTGNITPAVAQKIVDTVNASMAAHLASPDPHHQYLLRTEASALQNPAVKKPVNLSPTNGFNGTGAQPTLTLGTYYSLYGLTQGAAEFRISRNANAAAPYDFDTVVSGTGASFTPPSLLLGGTTYWWQGRYRDSDGTWSEWSDPTSFGTGTVSVGQPAITAPANAATINTNGMSLTSSAFTTTGYTDTHKSTDWEIWTGPNGTGTLAFSSYGDTNNKTSIAIAQGKLANNTTFYPRVRYNATALGASAWSAAKSFTVAYPPYPTVIGDNSFGGGYYAGDYTFGGKTYVILVAPKATGETSMALAKTKNQFAGNDQDSVLNTTNLKAFGSLAADWVDALAIGGFSDWVIPSLDVLKIMYNNLAPGGANTPAPFKTNGAEAMTAVQYWSSSPYDHVVDESYYDADTPIYQDQISSYEDSRSFNYGPTGESVNYRDSIKCALGEGGPNGAKGPDFTWSQGVYGPGGERIGYYSASWTCTVVTVSQVVVGYQKGAYHQVLTNYYDARLVHLGTGVVGFGVKINTYRIRAVRLVAKT